MSLTALRPLLLEVRRDSWASEHGEVSHKQGTPQLLAEITAEVRATARILSRRLAGGT